MSGHRKKHNDALQVDLFWSFRSPYAYMVLPRLLTLKHDFNATVRARVVYPLVMRDQKTMRRFHPQFFAYWQHDVARTADFLGMTVQQPDPDVVAFANDPLQPLEQQPRIHRLMRLAAAADQSGKGLEFLYEVGTVIFGGTRNWDQGDHLQHATDRAGLTLDVLDTAISVNPEQYDQLIAENERAQAEAGHWGVPVMAFNGEAFFGQDRFDQLQWRLEQAGLQARIS